MIFTIKKCAQTQNRTPAFAAKHSLLEIPYRLFHLTVFYVDINKGQSYFHHVREEAEYKSIYLAAVIKLWSSCE